MAIHLCFFRVYRKTKHLKFIDFCSYSRNIPILAILFESKGSKFISLVNRLEISKDTLSRTLKTLIKRGFVKKNPGYGHPLRPEYILTPDGYELGKVCSLFLKSIKTCNNTQLLFNKWSLPILYSLNDEHLQFNKLKSELESITSSSLSRSLKELIENGFIQRIIKDDFPPIIEYSLTNKSNSIKNSIVKIALTLKK